MEEVTLTKTRLVSGVWEGLLRGAGDETPDLGVSHLGDDIPGLTVTRDTQADGWVVRVPLPVERLADGVQTFLIVERQTGTQLASFTLITGDVLSDDIRAEMNLLREELDMLKRAFRRHCLETM